MNTHKRQMYIENLYGGLHTVALKTGWIDVDAIAGHPIVKSCVRKKIRGKEVYEYYLQLNPNKGTNCEIVRSFSQYMKIIKDLLAAAGCSEFTITRADFAFNSDDSEDFQMFRKLNKLLIFGIAEACKTQNNYETFGLWNGVPLNAAVKNGYIEAENYDKDSESKGKAQAKNRLELRSKRISCNLPEEFLQGWFSRLDKAVEQFQAVQDRLNEEMVRQWTENQNKGRKDREFLSMTQFILWNRNRIFTRGQLESLLDRIGSKNPKTTAKKLKNKHRIEFFSLTDLRIITKELKKIMTNYFQR